MKISSDTETQKSVRYLKGIGPRKFELLQKLGVQTIADLCYLFPRRYEDRSHFHEISELKIGSFATLRGKIASVKLKPLKKVQLLEVWLQDESGVLPAIWFNQPYLKNIFQVGSQLILSGKVDRYQNRFQLVSPEYEILDSSDDDPIHTGRITPIYPLTEGLYQRSIRVVMKDLVQHDLESHIKEYLPQDISKRHQLLNLTDAIREVHFPSSYETLEKARTRLIFDEFFLLELKLLKKLYELRTKHKSVSIPQESDSLKNFKSNLRFHLTEDQEKVIQEIAKDVNLEIPMNRLLQGEVGSGKTIVAAYFLHLAAERGFQAALLAPTEVLSEQHEATLKQLLRGFPKIRIELLTASVAREKRDQILGRLSTGGVQILIGTHAVLQETVNFKKLGLVVIDEQHKFGVRQRGKLLARNPRPHLLVMSATPIPRTLGLTLYGDLDISTIRQLPKGRKPIHTEFVPSKDKQKIILKIKERVERGEQAYILFPIIEETEKLDVQAAKQEFERLKNGVFKLIPMGLIHGRLEKAERDHVMHDFQNGKLKILIATSVIEVGIDNPNATVMVIENADRFGLSQLHQIRGRIGRGSAESFCYLIANPKTDEAKKRLEIMTQTTDGFVIAEEDLKLRGPGEFFGLRQSGIPPFRLADIVRDGEILVQAREDVKKILEIDPLLSRHENLRNL